VTLAVPQIAWADETQSDNFNSSSEGWSGASRVWFNGSMQLEIERGDNNVYKTFDFGTSYANADVTITFDLTLDDGQSNDSWETSDSIFVYVNSSLAATYHHGSDGTYAKSITAQADSSGRVTLKIDTSTSVNNEVAYLDNVSVTALSPAAAISCSTLRDSDNLSTSHTSYTNASHYNDSGWNVGPGTTEMGRAYYFTVDGPGTVDIDLSRVDNDQARFSVAEGSCPTSLDGLSSTQLTFASAGDFYVYVYYVAGSHNNIEYQLDVVFTSDHANAVNDSYSTPIGVQLLENVLANDSGTGIQVTSNTEPANGTLSIASDGNFTYTPNPGYAGNDSFSYTITDTHNNTDTATVSITVDAQYTSGSQAPFVLINPDYSRNLIGDYRIAGNTVLCLTEKTTGYGGTCQGDNSSYLMETSNNHVSKYLDIDSDSGTWDSTSSNINFPATYNPGRGVVWAGLFWQGRIAWDTSYDIRYAQSTGTGSYTNYEPNGHSVTVANTQAPNIKLKVDSGNYNDVHAATFHT